MGRLLIRNRLAPDFRQQMLASNCQKDSFTHEHADHTSGIDDIRPFNFKQGEIPIYAHDRVINNLKTFFIFSQR
jgi:phosphoribosyl 1,2-cyclic phosphate phosphodiesterase